MIKSKEVGQYYSVYALCKYFCLKKEEVFWNILHYRMIWDNILDII